MQKIIFEKEEKIRKTKRHAVVIGDENYLKIREINFATDIPVEKIVNRLLEEALKNVEVQDVTDKD